ncbi:MAG: hypothetical protein KAS72_03850 [Phycisphaerales bacterium]|nr:hypothetical protein [Phycisphaerales bacterium]
MRRKTARILSVVLVLAALLLTLILWQLFGPDALDREMTAWRRAGLPLTYEDCEPLVPPEDQNGALRYLKIISPLDADVIEYGVRDGWHELDDLAALRAATAPFDELLEEAHELARSPHSWAWPKSEFELLPELAADRDLVRLLRAAAVASAVQDDPAGAAELIETGLLLNGRCSSRPGLISWLVLLASDSMLLETLERCGAQAPLPDRRIEEILEGRQYRGRLMRACYTDVAALLEWDVVQEALRTVSRIPGLNRMARNDLAAHLVMMREASEHLSKSYYLQEDPRWTPTVFSETYSPEGKLLVLNANAAAAEIKRRQALLAIRLRRAKALHGSYAAALEHVEILKNPVTNEPLVVDLEGEGFVIRAPVPDDWPLDGGYRGEGLIWRWEE